MSNYLSTAKADHLFDELKPIFRSILIDHNRHQFKKAQELINALQEFIKELKASISEDPNLLNDIWVLNCFIQLIDAYGRTWEKITANQFVSSWDYLQSCFDLIRAIKKFSKINVQFFEQQLLALEKLYPYNVFFSVGMVVEYFECSICGHHIDSPNCIHLPGNLYSGEMAKSIGKNIMQIDHIAMTHNPHDKRCVVKYNDTDEAFNAVSYLATLLTSNKFQISDFTGLEISKVQSLKPEYKNYGRNKICLCGSNKKFKNCCITKAFIETDHIKILATHRPIELAI